MAKALKLGTKTKTIQLVSPVQKIVDELGEVWEERKRLENREAALKSALYTYGPGIYSGRIYDAMSTEMKRTFYKTELLTTYVTPEVLKKCEVVTPYLKVTLQRKSI